MKHTARSILVLAGMLLAGAAHASGELARSSNCMACHAVAGKMLGPSYQEISARYANDKDAQARLALKIRKGGSGVWGAVPMPPNPQVSEEQARALAGWVLAQR